MGTSAVPTSTNIWIEVWERCADVMASARLSPRDLSVLQPRNQLLKSLPGPARRYRIASGGSAPRGG
jgi:hypothetical protein